MDNPSFIAAPKYLDLKLGLEIIPVTVNQTAEENEMPARLEHANYTVADPAATAAWMAEVFGWKIRWEGDAADSHTKHVGTDTQYVALYRPDTPTPVATPRYRQIGGLNHIAVVVDDIDATEEAVRAQGFTPGRHADYEPGRRFYFQDADGMEYEVVQYD
jgi:catechol 2,3-dioxygenase-like lactoylglutathione lyase family enzyme